MNQNLFQTNNFQIQVLLPPHPPFYRSGDGDGSADALVTPTVADDVKSIPARADSSLVVETDSASLSAVSALVTAL